MTLRAARLRERLATSMDASEDEDPSLLWAAVAIILTPQPDSILLIRRADRSGDPWSGHMALPGGRREAGDSDLAGTAIRETVEEVGIRTHLARLGVGVHQRDVERALGVTVLEFRNRANVEVFRAGSLLLMSLLDRDVFDGHHSCTWFPS